MKPALALVAAAVALSGCHHDPPPRLLQQTVGRGAVATTILREPGLRAPAPVVLFLHGWGATTPSYYRPWLEHLARERNVVLYPRYQDAIVTPPQEALGNVLAGVGLALRHVDVDPRSLVVAGHSAGGALAADYAAIARRVGLPEPRAVFAAYPGRSLRRFPRAVIPAVPGIPRAIEVVALASARDTVVGTATARQIVHAAPRGRYVAVRDPAVADHLGPERAEPASRRVFWRALDRLIARARRG